MRKTAITVLIALTEGVGTTQLRFRHFVRLCGDDRDHPEQQTAPPENTREFRQQDVPGNLDDTATWVLILG
jgi:hypothetical protein